MSDVFVLLETVKTSLIVWRAAGPTIERRERWSGRQRSADARSQPGA